MIKQFLAGLFLISFCYLSSAGTNDQVLDTDVGFIENEGQFLRSDNSPANEVLFKLSAKDMDLYITDKGLTYVFTKFESLKLSVESSTSNSKPETTFYRMDMNLAGAAIKKENVIAEYPLEQGHYNYYLAHCPNGIMNVRNFKKNNRQKHLSKN